jgi:hypothetical protein
MDNYTKTTIERPDSPVTAPTPRITDRDGAILHVLCHQLRVLSLPQIARTWWSSDGGPDRDASRRCARLAAAGLLTMREFLVQPELTLSAPLASWRCHQPPPPFAAVAHAASRRFSGPVESVLLIAATERAARSLGGHGGRLPRTSEATHDLHLATVYLWMRRRLPTRTESWRSEAWLADRRPRSASGKVPDAMVRDGHSRTAIEMVGQYSTEKLRAFHDYCAEQRLGYELW